MMPAAISVLIMASRPVGPPMEAKLSRGAE